MAATRPDRAADRDGPVVPQVGKSGRRRELSTVGGGRPVRTPAAHSARSPHSLTDAQRPFRPSGRAPKGSIRRRGPRESGTMDS